MIGLGIIMFISALFIATEVYQLTQEVGMLRAVLEVLTKIIDDK
jgi:hypothetical protein